VAFAVVQDAAVGAEVLKAWICSRRSTNGTDRQAVVTAVDLRSLRCVSA
jgi:hypothetical protein